MREAKRSSTNSSICRLYNFSEYQGALENHLDFTCDPATSMNEVTAHEVIENLFTIYYGPRESEWACTVSCAL